jgi:hypothetical protein
VRQDYGLAFALVGISKSGVVNAERWHGVFVAMVVVQ